MERQKPDTTSNDTALYLRTIYSLLRSTGEVRVRAFEEAHSFSGTSLHSGARGPAPDVAAFGYAAARLPGCMPEVERVVLAQSDQTFAAFGYHVPSWQVVQSRGRRRLLRFDGNGTLATYIASVSDIDDLIPILTAYQIEWNKMHYLLSGQSRPISSPPATEETPAQALDEAEWARLREALGTSSEEAIARLRSSPIDLSVRLLSGSFSEYQRAADLWWEGVEEVLPVAPDASARPPVYFVSSNTHALANLLGGFALHHGDRLDAFAREHAPNEVTEALDRATGLARSNLLYFLLRDWIHRDADALSEVQVWDHESGIATAQNRAHVDVQAQVVRLSELHPDRIDPRVRVDGMEALSGSDACIINIDYPLGMAAYHLLSRVGRGIGPLLGVYVMGKAATLNAQVGDVIVSRVVHDEHSDNTYMLRNSFVATDVAEHLEHGDVLDNQKAVTVRGPFLQNPTYMGVFYREGYTVLEMEAGPYLSAVYELVDPRRHPNDEIVNLSDRAPFDIGILHYVSDTPYSRRQWLLSKSLGVFGLDSTYACAAAITRRILQAEVARVGSGG